MKLPNVNLTVVFDKSRYTGLSQFFHVYTRIHPTERPFFCNGKNKCFDDLTLVSQGHEENGTHSDLYGIELAFKNIYVASGLDLKSRYNALSYLEKRIAKMNDTPPGLSGSEQYVETLRKICKVLKVTRLEIFHNGICLNSFAGFPEAQQDLLARIQHFVATGGESARP